MSEASTIGQRLARAIVEQGLDEAAIATLIDSQIAAAVAGYQNTSKLFHVDCAGAHGATNNLCAVPGCGLPRTGRSAWCKKHDMRARRHGDPTVTLMPRRNERIAPSAAGPIDDLTIGEAAERCGVSDRRVQDLIYAGRLTARKVSGIWLIERASVEAYAVAPRKAGRPRKQKAEQ